MKTAVTETFWSYTNIILYLCHEYTNPESYTNMIM